MVINYFGSCRYAIWSSFFIALILQILPFPKVISSFQPNWIILVLLYWVFTQPYQINISTIFIVGIILDLVVGSTIGVHVLSMNVITYLVILRFWCFNNFAWYKQMIVVTLLSFCADTIVLWIDFLNFNVFFFPRIFCSSIITGACCPWTFLLIQKIRQHFFSQNIIL